MIRTRNLLWIIPLVIIAASPLWKKPVVDFLRPRGGFETGTAPPEVLKSFSLEDVTFLQSKAGRAEMKLKAETLFTAEDENLMHMKEVNAVIFHEDSTSDIHITGRKAVYNTKQEIVTLSDNVRVVTADGKELKTSKLDYSAREEVIRTDKPVVMTDNDMRLTGKKGLYYNLQSGDFKVDGRVTVDIP
mgnify:CR=1 FL=1